MGRKLAELVGILVAALVLGLGAAGHGAGQHIRAEDKGPTVVRAEDKGPTVVAPVTAEDKGPTTAPDRPAA
ncbi:hypothetical protein ACFVT1_08620 [Streptomyces sp. NPDC057963]|uniref:hypothetical protein n=1 Tax=Streptomyces sp. NPDC057963 TaxID=3346290 RepID=UPI0036E9F2A3